jgi:energy-converting hydrogenase Eha subunit A
MPDGFWRRHSWKFLLILTTVIGLFGVGDIIFGVDADPAIPLAVTGLTVEEIRATSEPLARLIDLQVQGGGIHLIVMSLLWGAILLVPFRRGERWAWHTMWPFPLWSVAVAVSWLFVDLQPDVPLPPPAISGWVFFGLTAALLWASRGAFHRPEDVGTTEHA